MRSSVGLAIGLLLMLSTAAHAREHRATRLGHPATRFAPPIESKEELRSRFRDPNLKPDFAIILQQVNWPGDVEDIHRAAATVEVTEIRLPVGTRMPFMSSRENGHPVALIDVVWSGNEPVGAYEFFFSSRGRRYRCVTPKPCSNFYVEDLGSEPPRIELKKTAPAEASLCDPIDMSILVHNTGTVPVTQVHLIDAFPAGLKLRDGRTTLDMDAGALQPGEARELRFSVFASAAGTYVNEGRAVTAEGAIATATTTTVVRAPALTLECGARAIVLLGRPIELCLTVKNTGDAPEPHPSITLPIPPGSTLVSITEGGMSSAGAIQWELSALAPGESRNVCAVFGPTPQPGSLDFAPSVRGTCAPPASVICTIAVRGVPGILLEVVDLVDPVEVNQEVEYVITATNQGSIAATNLRMVCLLPPAQEFVSATGATVAETRDHTVRFAPLPSLGPKETATWRVKIRAVEVADSRFQTELTTDQFDRPIIEVESTHQY